MRMKSTDRPRQIGAGGRIDRRDLRVQTAIGRRARQEAGRVAGSHLDDPCPDRDHARSRRRPPHPIARTIPGSSEVWAASPPRAAEALRVAVHAVQDVLEAGPAVGTKRIDRSIGGRPQRCRHIDRGMKKPCRARPLTVASPSTGSRRRRRSDMASDVLEPAAQRVRTMPSQATSVPGRAMSASAATWSMKSSSWDGS